MKVGSLVYPTDQGIGIIAKHFHEHGVITDPLVVLHSSHPNHRDWYPGAEELGLRGILNQQHSTRAFCERMDTMLFIETPFDWSLIDYCRAKGVKTVLLTMYECTPERLPVVPDAFLCPSLLDFNYFDRKYPVESGGYVPAYFLPIPVEVPWRQRTRAEVFVHNAGHGGLRGRNGTAELLQAIRLVQSSAKFIIRCQDHHNWPPYPELLGRVELREGTQPYSSLFQEGDVFVFPEKFAGDSLPLAEARAAGMLVMATDRFPMCTWLPGWVNRPSSEDCIVRCPLISVQNYVKVRVNRTFNEFDEAVVDPRAIANKIDEWYGRDITDYSLSGRDWAKTVSWDALKTKYLEVLCP